MKGAEECVMCYTLSPNLGRSGMKSWALTLLPKGACYFSEPHISHS